VLSSFIMSSRKVVINGVTYIRSRDAARAVNLALDYVSRLARHGAISGQRVSGIWFVDPTSLQNFIAEQERQKQLLRARFAQMRREEQRAAGHQTVSVQSFDAAIKDKGDVEDAVRQRAGEYVVIRLSQERLICGVSARAGYDRDPRSSSRAQGSLVETKAQHRLRDL
jgi:hypothetical protein